MKWTECEDCGESYRIVHESLEPPIYCPFCGCESREEDDLEDEDDY